MSALANAVYVLSLLSVAIRADDAEKERVLVPLARRAISAGPWRELLSVRILAYGLERTVRDGITTVSLDVDDALGALVEYGLERVTSIDDEPTVVPDGEECGPVSDTLPSGPPDEMAVWPVEAESLDMMA